MKKSSVFALLFILLICAWMVSGLFSSEPEEQNQTQSESQPFSVEVTVSEAQVTPVSLVVQGQTVPERLLEIKAQTAGRIEQILVSEGDSVRKGDTLLTIDMEDRLIQLEQQEALYEARKKTYKRLSQLADKQYQSESELDTALANVKASEAAIANIRSDINFVRPVAPFDGEVQSLSAESGDVVSIGDPMLELVDNSVLVVEIQIAQQRVNEVKKGLQADIKLATGEQVSGKVRFIAPYASSESRTYLAEIGIPNPDGKLKSGSSATVTLHVNEVKAHYVSPATFTLDADGRIGVKSVGSDNKVEFHQVSLLQSDNEGAWVTGLPDTVRLITTGQGFVDAGNVVTPVEKAAR
ncbi:efflux RND transporter periplasmic adaptor subunit [Alteromonas sp. RKMC-009]|uniref:efflux RND transporter periplasmic adaptor subunit n=1 Tax=Alteromonas sp. RKMC-009 TaxID=2267264 RepID=UPI000E696DBD|nr:efflux RND transporter periplasmic adaptor subunit [Alteromonas sp. RKMC-009]AYA64000.1 efflux RND transporter periplasmic adaptor subunit [Alteromonas sp. RKMC-009]